MRGKVVYMWSEVWAFTPSDVPDEGEGVGEGFVGVVGLGSTTFGAGELGRGDGKVIGWCSDNRWGMVSGERWR